MTSNGSHSAAQSPREAINFQGVRVPVGYVAEYTISNRTSFPRRRGGRGEISTKATLELLKSVDGRQVWKITENSTASTTNNTFVRRGFLSQGEPYYQVTDEFGNLVETRGGNPDRTVYFGEFPTKPVRVGDSWAGFHYEKGARRRDEYRLSRIDLENGRRAARIDGRLEMRGGYTTGYRIVDLSTNQELESYQHGTFTNFQGVVVEAEMRSALVRASAEP